MLAFVMDPQPSSDFIENISLREMMHFTKRLTSVPDKSRIGRWTERVNDRAEMFVDDLILQDVGKSYGKGSKWVISVVQLPVLVG